MADVDEYRGYLITHPIIAEPETHFLDANEDLICMGEQSDTDNYDEDMATTPMPRRGSILSSPKTRAEHDDTGHFSTTADHDASEHLSVPMNLVMAAAVVVPTLTFSVIPGYLGRMAVVALVALGVLGGLLQSRLIGLHATKGFCICAGAYGAIMAVIAGVCR